MDPFLFYPSFFFDVRKFKFKMSYDMMVSIARFFDIYHGTERLPYMYHGIYMGTPNPIKSLVNAEKSKALAALGHSR